MFKFVGTSLGFCQLNFRLPIAPIHIAEFLQGQVPLLGGENDSMHTIECQQAVLCRFQLPLRTLNLLLKEI